MADFIPPGSYVVDVGTDHAYLPVALIQTEVAKKVYASEIAEQPLQQAAETLKQYGLDNDDRIELILSDGLEAITPISVDTIVIAGMGAETIIGILDRAPWTKSEDVHLLLQPMTRANELRRYLYERGYCILEEFPVNDHGHLYTVMEVEYAGFKDTITDVFSYIGKVPFHETGAREEYLQFVINMLEKKKKGLEASSRKSQQKEARKLGRTIKSIRQILKGIEQNANGE